MVAYLRCNLLLTTTSPPGSEAHVRCVELNHATQLCWGSKLSGLTVAHPHRVLWDCRANLHSVLLPPEFVIFVMDSIPSGKMTIFDP